MEALGLGSMFDRTRGTNAECQCLVTFAAVIWTCHYNLFASVGHCVCQLREDSVPATESAAIGCGGATLLGSLSAGRFEAI